MDISLNFYSRVAAASVLICVASMAFPQSSVSATSHLPTCTKSHCKGAAVLGKKIRSAAERGSKQTITTFHPHTSALLPLPLGSHDSIRHTESPHMKPVIVHNILSSDDVFTVYTKPLYTTAIRLPDKVSTIAVGAPTLFKVEHSKGQPRLVFVKPSTHAPADSNLIIALSSGAVVSIHLISPGDITSHDPVDFLVDYTPQHSLLLASATGPELGTLSPAATPMPPSGTPAGKGTAAGLPAPAPDASAFSGGSDVVDASPLQPFLAAQEHVAAQAYLDGHDLARVYPIDKYATNKIGVAFGKMQQHGDTMTFAYSVINRTRKWIEVLPPQIQFQNPAKKRHSKKHPDILAETIPVASYLVSARKVGPGGRIDGVVRFDRPSFKSKKEKLMLQLALADQIDKSILIPVPFVVAGPLQKERHANNHKP